MDLVVGVVVMVEYRSEEVVVILGLIVGGVDVIGGDKLLAVVTMVIEALVVTTKMSVVMKEGCG